jgi:homoserine kinase
MREAFAVSVPASSANLGPGFDAVGIALDLRLRARVDPARRFSLEIGGKEAPSHGGYADAILAAMRGIDERLPAVRVRVENDIPLGKGLGSSAAARVLGLAVASRASGRALSRDRLAELACELEGHPDNAFAAVYGGAVIAALPAPRSCVRISAPRDVRALVVVPEVDLSTEEARALLPERYDRSDVVFTAQRASLLGAALASGSWTALGEAMRDRVHQPYREARIPGLREALAIRSRELIGVALSGAGPSVLAFVRSGVAWRGLARRLESCFLRAGVGARSYLLDVAARGVSVRAAGPALARGSLAVLSPAVAPDARAPLCEERLGA